MRWGGCGASVGYSVSVRREFWRAVGRRGDREMVLIEHRADRLDPPAQPCRRGGLVLVDEAHQRCCGRRARPRRKPPPPSRSHSRGAAQPLPAAVAVDLRMLLAGHPRPFTRVHLGSAHPSQNGLRRRTDLRRNRLDRRPLRLMLRRHLRLNASPTPTLSYR
jgi:hypothetical protein